MRLAIFAAIGISANMAGAAPFGIEPQDFKLESYGCEQRKAPYYSCKSMPKPHSDVESYIIKYIESIGLCMIKGISVDIGDSVFGSNTRSKVDAIHAQLATKYGSGRKLDFIMPGSIWNEPEDWSMAVLKEERVYAYLWEFESPIDDVQSIALVGQMVSRDKGYFALEFHMPNKDECAEAEKMLGASSF